MMDCWKTNPGDRPSFKQMNDSFAEILNGMTDERALIQLDSQLVEKVQNTSYMMPI